MTPPIRHSATFQDQILSTILLGSSSPEQIHAPPYLDKSELDHCKVWRILLSGTTCCCQLTLEDCLEHHQSRFKSVPSPDSSLAPSGSFWSRGLFPGDRRLSRILVSLWNRCQFSKWLWHPCRACEGMRLIFGVPLVASRSSRKGCNCCWSWDFQYHLWFPVPSSFAHLSYRNSIGTSEIDLQLPFWHCVCLEASPDLVCTRMS